MSVKRQFVSCLVAASVALATPVVQAITFELDYGDGLTGTLNTVMTAGAAIRMQDRSSLLVGKGNLDPTRCGEQYQSCQGVHRDQIYPAQRSASAPGQATYNADDGNLNYDKHDLVQAPFKVTQDLALSYGEYGFFAKWLYFYDFVNNNFTEFHPNRITPENVDSVGTRNGPNNTTFAQVFGPGGVVRNPRTDGEVLRQIGTDLQMLDYYAYGTLPLWGEKQLTFKVGNQNLNWGESTALVINSLNQVNPVNANNLFRVGFDLGDLFVPTGMVYLSTELFDGATIEAFYGYDWKPLEIPAPGGFYSFTDIGTNNAVDFVGLNFGTNAEDPELLGFPAENPLSGITNTSVAIRRLPDNEASDSGQFGASFKYFAEWLNNGTELGFYFMNYHSKLPYVSFISADMSCARLGADHSQDGGTDQNATDLSTFGQACPDLPLLHGMPGGAPVPPELGVPVGDNNPGAATSSAVPFDSIKFGLEYPEDIQMYGISFNTTLGAFSIQGEVAYRPDMPLQVDPEDLAFHANGPVLSRCHDMNVGCAGTTSGGGGSDEAGANITYGASEFEPYPEWAATYPTAAAFGANDPCPGDGYCDTFALGVGGMSGSARSFPSFIGAYRGVAPGETPPNSYIRGWELFDVYQFNFGATYVAGATDNPIGADQMIWLFEFGAQMVPDLPGTDVLQIEGPGTYYHASAGADGSMTGNLRQDCSHTVDCHFGGDGARFNPHQENHDAYADDFSWGYVVINLTRYESVFPGVSFAPITIFQHDVKGTSTDVAAQFTEGRKDVIFLLETRYKEALSFNVGYVWFTGGGRYNLQKDRDQALMYVKYQF